MNSYERVMAAYGKLKSDHVPIYCGSVSSRIASLAMGRTMYVGGGIQHYRESLARFQGEEAHKEFVEKSRQDAFDWAEAMDFDYVRPSYWRYQYKPSKMLDDTTFYYEREDGTYWIMRYFDEYELFACIEDTKREVEDPDHLEEEVTAQEEYNKRYSPKLTMHKDYLDTMDYFNKKRATYTSGVALAIPNTRPVWYEAVAVRPDLVERYLEALTQRAIMNIPLAASIGAKIIYGGGDCACNRGLIYSNEIFKSLMVPRLRRISEKCHEYGLYHTFGSDGYFWDVADSFYIDTGIDAHYEADCSCGMDIRSIRTRYPNITVVGGIAASTLDKRSEEDVRTEVTEAVFAAKELSGAIVGCSNLVSPTTPIKNFMLMMELLHKYK
ncbi:MAG: uroporphyrinogen decarboxylase family protein [Clostridia bacterium]|jgi:hypothetical protein